MKLLVIGSGGREYTLALRQVMSQPQQFLRRTGKIPTGQSITGASR